MIIEFLKFANTHDYVYFCLVWKINFDCMYLLTQNIHHNKQRH